MVYPRRCPLCGAGYDAGKGHDLRHATVRAAPGGTPDPRRPGDPGRLLRLRCLACRGEYVWDYFAEQQAGDPEVGARVRMKATGRTGTIREVLEARGRKLYCVVYDPTAPAGPAPIPGEAMGEFTVYTAADTLDVLP